MANVIGSLFVEIRASLDKFHDDLGQVSRDIRAFDKDMKPITDRVKEFGEFATKTGTMLTAMVTAPIAAVAGLGLQFNAMAEQAQIGFTTMLGSGEKAQAFLSDLKDFAAKTPFEFPDLVRASQKLIAVGFAAEQVKPMMTALGNAVAGLGGGAAEIDRVTKAFGDMHSKTRVATQEMNQLTEIGIPAWNMLAQGMGVTEAKLRDMVEKGLVPADKAIQILVDGMNQRFPDMMERQSHSFAGLLSTIKDETRFLAGDLTEGLFNALKGPAESLAGFLHDLRMSMSGWSNETKATIAVVAGLAAAVGPLLIIVGQMALGINQLVILGGHLSILFPGIASAISGLSVGVVATTAGIVALGAAIGVAIGTFVNWIIKVTGLTESFDKLLAAAVRTIPVIGPWITGANAMADAAGNLTKAQQQLVAEFAKHGVQVDQARLNDSKYLAELAEISKAWANHTTALKTHTATRETLNLAVAKTAAELHKEEQQWIKNREAMYEVELAIRRMNAAYDQAAPTMPMPIQTGLPDFAPIGTLPTLPRVGLPPNLGPTPTASTEVWDHYRQEGQKAIDNIVNDMSRMFVDGIIHGKNMWESFKNLGQNAVAGIIDTLMTKMLHSFLDPFATAVGKMLDGLTSGLTGFLSSFGSKLGGLLGIGGGAASSAASGAGGAISSAGGAASSVAGGASSILSGGLGGIIGGGIAAAGSLIGSMRLEGTMNAVEANTRFAAIHLGVMIDQLFWPWDGQLRFAVGEIHEHTLQLDAIYNVLATGRAGGAAPVGASTTNNNIALTVNVVAPKGQDAGTWGDNLISRINEALITDRGGLRSNIALVATQTGGIVSTVPAT